jgi:hypothetical protein
MAIVKPGVGNRAPDVRLTTPAGEPVDLSIAWRQGPALLVFLRHLG